MTNLFLGNEGAIISDDKNYRYALWRIWDHRLKLIMFIMLNPSTADEKKNDPTIHKCITYAKRWGYGGILIGNLYAFRSTNPLALNFESNPVGPDCDFYLSEMIKHVDLKIAAWGNNGITKGRTDKVKSLMGKLHYLELSKSGNPKHPLYLRKTLKPQSF